MKGLLTSLITILTFTGLQAQSLPESPRLVIGLTIDQLRSDYLEAFSGLYGEKGFKRLWKEGKVFSNARYSFAGIDRASAIAAIHTGTTPSLNGIVSARWLDTGSLQPVNCVEDPNFMGFYTLETSSAAKLLTSTVGDELKIATQGKGLVYSIAPFRDAAILGAGHAGDGAFWMNENSGKWCGTTYYNDFPWWVSQYNDREGLDMRIDNITWSPYLPAPVYTYLTSEYNQTDFKYKFSEAKQNKFRRLITSPLINEEINKLVGEFLNHSDIGLDNTPDILTLTYYAGNYNGQTVQETPLEIQDTYARLDQNIGELIDMVDRKIGLKNVLFVVTSTGYVSTDAADIEKYRIPGGEFYLNRCAALLNMYLMASYGEGQYIDGYFNQQIYLNHDLLEQKQLVLNDILEKCADFLIQFSGVNEVYSSHRLLLGAWTPDIHKIRNSYHRKRTGDLIIDVLPGWTIVDEITFERQVVRHGNIPVPLIFMGHSVAPEKIEIPVTIEHIAPTLSHFMRIRAPNACTTTSLK